jgi:hypothetical protein
METVIQNLTEIDRYGDKKFKFSHLDKFGTMLRFHIQGSYAYQTKVGSIFTLLYYFLVMSAFMYYSLKFADTSQPLVVMSEYKEEQELTFNIFEDQHIIYWQAMRYHPKNPISYILSRITGEKLSFEDFFSNFSLIASEVKTELIPTATGNEHKRSWNRIKFKPCNEIAYTKNFTAKITAGFENAHFCLDTPELKIYGGGDLDSQVLNVDLYDCTQSESPVKCKQTMQPHEIAVLPMVLEQTLNVKNIHNPYAYRHR